MTSIRRIANWAVGIPIAVIVVIFAVANRQLVTVSLDPLNSEQPWASISMPLWGLLFCGIFIGAIVGWIACWFAQGKWRRATRDSRVTLQRAEAEVLKLKQERQRELLNTSQM